MSSWNTLWDTVSPLHASVCVCVRVCVQLLCLVWLFFNPVDYSLPKSSVHGIFWPKTGVGCHFFLQGIFLTQGWNLCLPCLLHCRWILYRWTIGELTLRLRMFKELESNLRSINNRSEWNCNLPFHLQLLRIIQFYHLPPPLPPPGSNSSCLFTRCQSLYASYCIVLLYFSKYCTVKLKTFYFLFAFSVLYVWKVL